MRGIGAGFLKVFVFLAIMLWIGNPFSALKWSEMKVETTSTITLDLVKCSGESIVWVDSGDFDEVNHMCVLNLKEKYSSENTSKKVIYKTVYTIKPDIVSVILCIGIVAVLLLFWRYH